MTATILAAVAALAGGVLVAWHPFWVAAIGLAALVVWGLTPARLTGTLFAILFLVPMTADPGYPLRPVWVVLGVAAAVALVGRLRSWDVDAPLASPGLAGFALPAVLLAAALVQWSGFGAAAAGVLPFLAYALIAWHVVDDPAGAARASRALAWAGVVVAGLAVYQRLTGTWPLLDRFAVSEAFTSGVGVGRSAGTMGHPIIYGTFCMAMMCVAIGLRFRLWQVPFAANAVGLVLSGSRSAWIGAVCALALWYLVQPHKVTRRGVVTLGGLVLVGGLLAVAGPAPVRDAVGIVRDRLTDLTGQSSATARFTRVEEAWAGITESPRTLLFGRGPEAHVRFFQEIGISDGLAQAFDNSYLTMWYDHGLLGLAALLGLLAAAFVWTRSLPARLLLAGFAVQIWFFDCYLWPAAVAVPLLALGLATAARPQTAALPAEAVR
jgi:hypothetical protein